MGFFGKNEKMDREKVREALVNGASRHKLVARIVDRCAGLPETANKRLAAIAQTAAVLQCSPQDAEALVSEMMV